MVSLFLSEKFRGHPKLFSDCNFCLNGYVWHRQFAGLCCVNAYWLTVHKVYSCVRQKGVTNAQVGPGHWNTHLSFFVFFFFPLAHLEESLENFTLFVFYTFFILQMHNAHIHKSVFLSRGCFCISEKVSYLFSANCYSRWIADVHRVCSEWNKGSSNVAL